ncbi:YqbF domain-containing protein [Bacillus toyonensis]|uniref:YqbF domain-containing protein n=1 Tax=Bacillus toyonensis TaxID=155322 RepID=UPI003000B97A
MYFAKLIGGRTYDVLEHSFVDGIEQEVPQPVYNYLKENPLFETWEADGNKTASLFDGEKYTEAALKGLKKSQQEEIIRSLTKGDFIRDTKNEQERVALILELQEEE